MEKFTVLNGVAAPLKQINVDTDKIDASFRKGVLTVMLPKKPEAKKPEKRIDVKAV